MACSIRKNPSRETTTFLPSIFYFFIASNSLGFTCRAYSRGDSATVTFVVSEYAAFLLLEFFLWAFQRLPPHSKSKTKSFLQFAIWFVCSGILFGFVHYIGPLFKHPPTAFSLYAFVAVGSAVLFYVHVVWDPTSWCAECRWEDNVGKGKFQDYDFVIEKV